MADSSSDKDENFRPLVRWWWFNQDIQKEDIKRQLDWAAKNHFGGVEIAFIYPLEGQKKGPRFLSSEWSGLVDFAKKSADGLDLRCDFTFGSMWPFGGSFVREEYALRTFNGLSDERLEGSWESAHEKPGFVVNHLDRNALYEYSRTLGTALGDALNGSSSSLFCDSWEIDCKNLWTPGFDEAFLQRFGYSLDPYKRKLDKNPDVRYDYRKLLADFILNEFYSPFTEICHGLKTSSRVQCHGSLTDLLAAYAAADIPESEAILFDPKFSRFAASAAALSGKETVSAEAFTCLYGFNPALYKGLEQIADIKLLADSLFANGINQIVWHGMPFNPKGGKNEFYASVHVGPDSNFADQLSDFNLYLERVSGLLRQGKPVTDVAVYVPLEDNWMRDRYPHEMMRPGGAYFFDLRHERLPHELAGRNPSWISKHFLKDAEYKDGKLRAGDAEFGSLYIDVFRLDSEALADLVRLGDQGLRICLKKSPRQPGHVKDKNYQKNLEHLASLPNIKPEFGMINANPAFLEGENLPEYICRKTGDDYILFLAHPKTNDVCYPMKYGQSYCDSAVNIGLAVNINGRRIDLNPVFNPYQSLVYCIKENGEVSCEDISFIPKTPKVVKKTEKSYRSIY